MTLAYIEGFNINGTYPIKDIKPELYFAVPKGLDILPIIETEMTTDLKGLLKARFIYKGMIPHYELTDIS